MTLGRALSVALRRFDRRQPMAKTLGVLAGAGAGGVGIHNFMNQQEKPSTDPVYHTYRGGSKQLWSRPALPPTQLIMRSDELESTFSKTNDTSRLQAAITRRGFPVKPVPRVVDSAFNPIDKSLELPRHAPRSVVLHEYTHAVDPRRRGLIRDIGDDEVPAMVSETNEARRAGQYIQPNLWTDMMQKHGPQFTGDDSKDLDAVEGFMKDFRGDTELGRRYREWLEALQGPQP